MARGRRWTSEEKAKIVLQGLKGRPVAELCNEYQIHQQQYYTWRDKFLENASKVFETNQQSRREERLERENKKLKTIIGDLTVELKKSEHVEAQTPAARACMPS
jgi:transposase-like protein